MTALFLSLASRTLLLVAFLATAVQGQPNVNREASFDKGFEVLLEALQADPQDVGKGNALRMHCLTFTRVDPCIDALKGLVKAHPEIDALRYNAALAYVDKLPGHTILKQGWYSTRSMNLVTPLLEADTSDWLAFYIRGMNHLHWPAWFNRTDDAIADLSQCLTISRNQRTLHKDNPYHVLAYIALGDAYAKDNQYAQARTTWEQARSLYPGAEAEALATRLKQTDEALPEYINAIRDLNKPIDTDLGFLWQTDTYKRVGLEASTRPVPSHIPVPRGPSAEDDGDWSVAPPPKRISDSLRSRDRHYKLNLIAGRFYGPGPLPDQDLNPGSLVNLKLDGPHFLEGAISFFNNAEALPNVPGEEAQGTPVDGKLSDGTLINEHVDVGHVKIMNNQFHMILAAVNGGPNQGKVHFFLDEDWNWTIQDDVAVDPGFADGIVKVLNFRFSTGPSKMPPSIQTQKGYPGGMDRSGSVASGEYVMGRLGDDDHDGYLDGVFVGYGLFPLDAVVLPGAPACQTRTFTTDIPVSALEAALVTSAGLRNCARIAAELTEEDRTPEAETFMREVSDRLGHLAYHVQQAAREPGADAATLAGLQAEVQTLQQKAGTVAPGQRHAFAEHTHAVFQALLGLTNHAIE